MSVQPCDPTRQSADEVGFVAPADSGQRYASEQAIVEAARHLGETVLGPNAQESDQMDGPNPVNFRALAEAGLLGLALPKAVGGLDASGATQRDVAEIFASYCGVTTFTQAQHHGPSRMILGSDNEHLKQTVLPLLARGEMLCAVSFAHLRRPGPPVLRAEPVANGYRLNGTTPWVTGWGIMNQVVFGATLPDERFVYVWVPGDRSLFPDLFADNGPEDGQWGELRASAPLALCALNASATVELTCDNLFVPQQHRLSESDRETMRRNDRNGVLGATAMPLGCAAGSVRLLCATAEKRGIPAAIRAAESFAREWQETRDEVHAWSDKSGEPGFFEYAVRLRARVIELGIRAAMAAVAANSGSANYRSHPAQRLYREAMFYALQAQTMEVMDSTLALLERP